MGSWGGLVVGEEVRMCWSVHDRCCSTENESTYETTPYSRMHQCRVGQCRVC